MKLYDQALYLDDEKFISESMWDGFISSATINENRAENEIRQYLIDSETTEQKKNREFMLKTYEKILPYKEASSKSFKAWAQDLREADIQCANMYYFSVK